MLDRPTETRTTTVQRWAYDSPLWLLAAATIAVSVAIHGYGITGAMPAVVWVAENPFSLDPDLADVWLYQSPLGPMLAWALGVATADGIALVHFALTIGCVIGCAYAVRRWVSDFAARLFLLAFFCSPNSRAAVSFLGLFDILTVAALTIATVGTSGPVLAAGIVIGFNHFEQAAVGAVAVAVVRLVIRRESDHRPVLAFIGGLVAGKAALTVYLIWFGLPTNGRLDFIRDRGVVDIIGGWVGHVPVIVWAVFNVLWVAVFWMLRDSSRRDRIVLAATFAVVSVPVALTYDLSRVYRNVTWPLVMLVVLYAAEHRDRAFVRRGALVLAAAAIFVPRTEVWHGGMII